MSTWQANNATRLQQDLVAREDDEPVEEQEMSEQKSHLTREELIEQAKVSLENLSNLLPDTIPYHPDTQMRVDLVEHGEGLMMLTFTLQVVAPGEKDTDS